MAIIKCWLSVREAQWAQELRAIAQYADRSEIEWQRVFGSRGMQVAQRNDPRDGLGGFVWQTTHETNSNPVIDVSLLEEADQDLSLNELQELIEELLNVHMKAANGLKLPSNTLPITIGATTNTHMAQMSFTPNGEELQDERISRAV